MKARLPAACALLVSLYSAGPVLAETPSEVIVTGHKRTRPAREPSLAATRIEARELARPGASAGAVLSHVAGVQIAETGASSELATASVRGASSAQTPVYLAGIRLNDDLTGSADLSLIPLWMLARAEVFRGHAPRDADRLGIGGAIYFEPRLPRANRVLAGAEIGSFGQRAAWLGAEVAQHRDAALLAFRASHVDNDYPYRDNAGTTTRVDDRTRDRPNADSSQRDAWAVGRTSLGPGGARLTTVINAFEREQGVTGLAVLPALSARSRNARLLVGVSSRVPCAGEESCEVVLSTQLSSARSSLSDPGRELGLLATRVDSRATRFHQAARLELSGQRLRALFGADAELERLSLDGASAVRVRRSSGSARAALTLALDPSSEVSGLALFTCDVTRGAQRDSGCRDWGPEARLGARRSFGALELRSNLGRYARVPTLGELYGVSPVVRGSSGLISERALTLDVGARLEGAIGPIWAYVDAFGFARRVRDLIAYRRSSVGAVQPYNVGQARIWGGELEAGAQWLSLARAALTLTVLDPRDTTADRNLKNDWVPYQSRFTGTLFVEGFVEPGVRGLRRAGLDARVSQRSSRLADPAGLVILPASTTVDLGAELTLGRDLAAEAVLRCAVDDVFDARHFDFIGYPVPGRRYHCGLEAWW